MNEMAPTEKEKNPDEIHAQVENDLNGVPFREPVVDDEDVVEGEGATVDRQWRLFTEALRKDIQASPAIRRVAETFTAMPLSETLPGAAVSEIIKDDPRVARLARHMGALGVALSRPAVPDEVLIPDITNAPQLIRREQETELLERWKRDLPNHYGSMLESLHDNVEQSPGITWAERRLVARRYRYARDVKLLGLMAELQDQPMDSLATDDGIVAHELRSGAKLIMDAEAFAAHPELFDPQAWDSRTQLKDRVYTVVVDGEEYIMKERKTPRHTDVKKHGHKEGLTSREEFQAAQEFAGMGTIEHGDIRLHWEKPLGFVEFPDGYQFCLFESEPGLKTDIPTDQLTLEIMQSEEAYAEEFMRTQHRAKELYHQRDDLFLWYKDQNVAPRPKGLARLGAAFRRERRPRPDELTFDEFAKQKARYMITEASTLLARTIWSKDYTNSDVDGYALRVRPGERPILDVIGFDFEYYAKDPDIAERMRRYARGDDLSGDTVRHRAYLGADSRAIELAASYALLEQAGLTLPPALANES